VDTVYTPGIKKKVRSTGKVFAPPKVGHQWCTGSGFWSPTRPDIWILWIWMGMDIVSYSTGPGLSKWNEMWPCKISWYGI